MTNKLTCLRNADGETVGYFSDYPAEVAARKEWDEADTTRRVSKASRCRSHEVAIAPLELENVEPGDGDRVDYCIQELTIRCSSGTIDRVSAWHLMGAASVEVQRFLINKYRRPNRPSRDSDLGGPAQAAGVLYVLKIKASR